MALSCESSVPHRLKSSQQETHPQMLIVTQTHKAGSAWSARRT